MRSIERFPECLEVSIAILNVILQANCTSISDIPHLQRAWECSILPLLIPSVNLMHDENEMLAYEHNFKIGRSKKNT